MQVEEEEEEVDNDDSDSDERNTYTVEDDYDGETSGRRTVGGRRATGAPLLNQHGTVIILASQIAKHNVHLCQQQCCPNFMVHICFVVGRGKGRYQYNYWSPENGTVLNNARASKARPPTRRKQQVQHNHLKYPTKLFPKTS